MPYNPQVDYKGSDYLFQGISSFGDSIAGGISKRAENKKRDELEKKLDQEKAKLEHEEYKEFLMRAQALEPDKTKRKGLETKSTGELKGFVQSGLDRLTRQSQEQNIASAKANMQAAQERTKTSEFGREQQIEAIQQREDFNRRLNEYGRIGLDEREAFMRAASETGVVDHRQPGAYIPAQRDIHGPEDMGVMRPVKDLPGMGYIGTSRSGGQLVPLNSQAPAGRQASPSDLKTLTERRDQLIQEASAGGINPARKQEIFREVQWIEGQLPWTQGQGRPNPAPQLEGSTAVRRFNPQTNSLE